MKKAFAIVLIACVAFGIAFAKSADIKVGGQLGFGGMSLKVFLDPDDSSSYMHIGLGGFMFAGTAEYQVSDALSARAEVGMNIFGKAKVAHYVAGHEAPSEQPDTPAGAHFIIYLGAQYNLQLTKEISLGLGAGFDVLMGKLVATDKEDTFNAGMGLGAEVVGSYAIDKNISVNLGGKFAWHFINTNKEMKEQGNITNLAYQIFAGATYAL